MSCVKGMVVGGKVSFVKGKYLYGEIDAANVEINRNTET